MCTTGNQARLLGQEASQRQVCTVCLAGQPGRDGITYGKLLPESLGLSACLYAGWGSGISWEQPVEGSSGQAGQAGQPPPPVLQA